MKRFLLLLSVLISLWVSPSQAALVFASGTFTLTSGIGTQQITDATCAQPRVVIAYWTLATSTATFTAKESFGIGIAVDRATDQQSVITFYNEDNVATTDSADAKSITEFIKTQGTVGPGYNLTATISSFNSDGFTINKVTNDGTNLAIVKYICLGGSDLTDAFLKEYATTTTTGNVAYTGIGFQGNLGLFTGMFAGTGSGSATDYELFFGAAKSSTERGVAAVWGNDGSGSANQAESYINSSACLALGDGGGMAIDNLADFVSWDSDGFTLNASQATTGRSFFALILQGTFRSAIGQQARTTAGAPIDQDVTTPGFQPLGVILAGTFATANATETTQGHFSFGAATASSSHGLWVGDAASINTDANMYITAANVYTQATNPSTVAAQASLTSMLSTGYRLNFGTTDANARLFFHLALASAATTRRPNMPLVFQ